MSVLHIVGGLLLLVIGGELLVRSSVSLSFKLHVSKLVIGMTVVSFATSAPELIVSVQSAYKGSPDLALGNVIGSNIANIALVLGITAIISPLFVDREFFKIHWPKMMIASVLLYYFLKNDLILSRIEGGILFFMLLIFVIVIIYRTRKLHIAVPEDIDESLKITPNFKIILWLVLGGFALWIGSEFLIQGAKDIAKSLGVTERIIGVSVVAFGTSIPELAASVIAALRREKAISLGNLIGSNIFNIGSVLGITALIHPLDNFDIKLLHIDIFWMIGVALLLVPLVLTLKRNRISRFEGFVLLGCYIGFIYWSVL